MADENQRLRDALAQELARRENTAEMEALQRKVRTLLGRLLSRLLTLAMSSTPWLLSLSSPFSIHIIFVFFFLLCVLFSSYPPN